MISRLTEIKVVALLVCLVLTGCDTVSLDKSPETTLNPDIFWQSEKDAVAAVNQLYTFLPPIRQTIYLDKYSDIAVGSAVSANNFIAGRVDATFSGARNQWNQAYRAIRATNYFLENADRVEGIESSLLTRLKAEARFIRAINYMELVMFFGDVPLVTSTLQVSEGAEVERADKEAIWDFIDSELTAISGDLPVSYSGNEDSGIGRVTRGAALALKARSMLYAKRWRAARDAAQDVIDLGVYSLHPDYSELFKYEGEYNPEVILQRTYTQSLSPHSFPRWNAPRTLIGTQSAQKMSVTRTLIDAYEMENGKRISNPTSGYDPSDPYRNRDPRLQATIWLPVFDETSYADTLWGRSKRFDTRPGSGNQDEALGYNVGNRTGFLMKKYIDQEDMSDPTNSGINFMIIRYPEVLLTYAEAKVELGELDQSAIDAVNQVRQRPSVSQPPLQDVYSASELNSQDQMREIVRHERMIELALEGLRFFDIRRWGIAEDVMQGPIPGLRYKDIETGQVTTLEWGGIQRTFTNRDYLWPIPQRERELNPNLTQNPGW